MCEFEQPCPEGESSRVRVDQLRRLIWMLMVWVSVLTLGLSAVITLHFILPSFSNKVASNKLVDTGHNLTTYDYYVQDNKNISNTVKLQWKAGARPINIKVEQDGEYFIYLQVTLLNENRGINYTVSLVSVNNTQLIIEGYIYGSQSSTGFMGRGFEISAETEITVICKPWVKISPVGTYLGIIKL